MSSLITFDMTGNECWTGWKLLRAANDLDILAPFDCQDDLHHALKEADALLICSDTSVDAQLLDAVGANIRVDTRSGEYLTRAKD